MPGADGECVIYGMQRTQRVTHNPTLDVAIDAANELRLPVAIFFGLQNLHSQRP